MVQMIPNSALITAEIVSIKPYPKQEGFRILTLKVQSASPKDDKRFIYNKKDDENMFVIAGEVDCDNMRLQNGVKIHAEVRKVSPKLWRIINFL